MVIVSIISAVIICLSFAFGQLARLHLFGIEFPLIDIGIVIFAFSQFLINFKQKKQKTNIFLIFFIIFSLFSFIFNHFLNDFSLLKPLFYYLRLVSLLSLFIFSQPLVPKVPFNQLLHLCLISNIIFGLIQYFFWPDFTYFQALNWDPHLYRLVSTFFDPTFTGLIYLLFLIDCFFRRRLFLTFITYLALALTYSRSSLIAFLIAFTFISFKRRQAKIFVTALIVFLTTILLLPRPPGEGTKLERTSSIFAKIENYRQGLKLFAQSPIVGIGYNHIALVRTDNKTGHEAWGYDSSLLNIAITNGIIGLVFFVLGLIKFFRSSSLNIQTMLLAIVFHSLFANSLLYPWTLCLLYFSQPKYHT